MKNTFINEYRKEGRRRRVITVTDDLNAQQLKKVLLVMQSSFHPCLCKNKT
jgi:DNA-directed RNA polymerase specialized sigma24 family protein